MADDTLGRIVALFVVAVFIAALVVSYVNPKHPVPPELYPITTLAVGYLLGHRIVTQDDKDKGGKARRRGK